MPKLKTNHGWRKEKTSKQKKNKQSRKNTIMRILDFLDINNQVKLKIDFRSNPASIERSKALKKIMRKRLFPLVWALRVRLRRFMLARDHHIHHQTIHHQGRVRSGA